VAWLVVTSAACLACAQILNIQDVPELADATTQPGANDSGDAGGSADAGSVDARDAADATLDATAGSDDAASDSSLDGPPAPDAPVSPCGDTTASAANCGRCGHSCLGGSCVDGGCQPFAIVAADAGVAPARIVVDDTYLYWTDSFNNTVTRTDKTTGASVVLQDIGSTVEPYPIAVDDTNLYWGDALGILWCPKSGCALNSHMAAGEYRLAPVAIAVDDAGVYWTEGQEFLLSVPKGAVNQSHTVIWNGGDASMSTQYLTSDGERVYFTALDGLLRVVPTDGGKAYALAAPGTPAGDPSVGVVVQPPNVYWTINDPDAGFVATAPAGPDAASNAASVFAPAQHYPGVIASDGKNLYWRATTSADVTAATVVSCSIAACAPTVLATTSTDLTAIAVDDSAVYWTLQGATSTSGSVWKLAK
jgi:hypothetical protein